MSNDVLQAPKADVLKTYRNADAQGKSILEQLFGKNMFRQKITDHVKSFEDACGMKGISVSEILNEYDTADEAAYKKLKVIIEVLNEGWKPDWNNSNQRKWYPWFNMQGGFGFSDSYYAGWVTVSFVGSRLCFHSEELAAYCATQFLDIYKNFLTISIDSNVKDNNQKDIDQEDPLF
jgi:hypothetical protein